MRLDQGSRKERTLNRCKAEPMFMTFDVRADGSDIGDPTDPCPMSALIEANEDADDFVAWLKGAKVGDSFLVGGGAAPIFRNVRVS